MKSKKLPVIKLSLTVNASIEDCFDLSRSIDLHTISTINTNERAIAGRQTGLIELNETVTWEAVHFGTKQQLTSVITAFNRPYHFRDEMVKGAFKRIKHDHYFEQKGKVVLMTDVFEFESPFGLVGGLVNKLFLTRYMTNFLKKRNDIIKKYAESDMGKQYLRSQETC